MNNQSRALLDQTRSSILAGIAGRLANVPGTTETTVWKFGDRPGRRSDVPPVEQSVSFLGIKIEELWLVTMIPMPNSMEWDGAGMGPPPPPPAASAVEAVGGIGDLTHSVEQQVAASNTATQSLHPSSTSLPGRHAPPSLPTLNLIGSIPSVVVVVGAGRQEEEGNKNELVTLLATNDTIRVRGKDCVGSVWEEEGTNVDEPPSSAMMVDATGFNTHGPRMQQQQKQQQRHLEEEDDVDDEWYHERNANLSQIALVDWADYNDDEDDENWTLPTNTLMMTGLGNSMEDDDCCSTPNSISTPAMSKILVQESFIISTSSTTTNGVDSPDMMDYQNH